jgi:DNA-binding PadR family transcriptional regulator
MQNSFLSNGYISGYAIRKDMNKAGFTDIAVGIALKTLSTTKGMLVSDSWSDQNGEPYLVYTTTPKGDQWLIENQDKLELKIDDVPF